MWVQSLNWEDPLEEGMATHSSILVWRIPWTEVLGVLQSTGLQRVGHDLVCMHGELLQLCPVLCHPMDCSPPDSSVHEILQARILAWVARPSSRAYS